MISTKRKYVKTLINKMATNMYDNLEDIVLQNSTNDITRKAKKKLREIAMLKTKSVLTEEEMEKLKQENYWKIFVPSSQKFFKDNKFNIGHSFRECSIEKNEACPICLYSIRKHMGVITNCNHSYCGSCLTNLIKKSKKIQCSLCRSEITKLDFHDEDNKFEIMKALSTKQ